MTSFISGSRTCHKCQDTVLLEGGNRALWLDSNVLITVHAVIISSASQLHLVRWRSKLSAPPLCSVKVNINSISCAPHSVINVAVGTPSRLTVNHQHFCLSATRTETELVHRSLQLCFYQMLSLGFPLRCQCTFECIGYNSQGLLVSLLRLIIF